MKKTLVLSLIVMILLAACKKDHEKPPISLKGKWNVESTTTKKFENAIIVNTVVIPGNGATFNFQDNGTVVLSHDGVIESQPFTIQSDSNVDIAGYSYEIRNLTASSVTLFLRDIYASGEFVEFVEDLKR
jgi:hypothetical protein